ncbi:hypothetical protein KI809_10525 [Geobacter pelophilus]|uniref:HTH cro/C1-type domain-containing protein n=1 Tax=Geoanaerobacter pelophilus TaxID=60036 RepID=A0AAW4L9M2_9BACT|nr:hypothetical protein [Geoanaerobacter pelophilus]MBT0664734.1 hypothetical protein [Geoanaerobacter pelophilus]
MNDIQRYLGLRNITCQQIANATGIGYHSIQKTVKGLRRCVRIRAAIAEYLDLDHTKLWGRGSVLYLRAQIAIEAGRQAEKKRQEIIKKYAPDARNIAAKRKAVNV